jgi:hypothetical protein
MTKRKMAALSAPAAAVAVDKNVQQVETPQLPLPNFTLSPETPTAFSIDLFALGNTSLAAIDNLGLMIDQHNNSGQPLVDYANSPYVGIRSDGVHAAENALIPHDEIDQLISMMDAGSANASSGGDWWTALDNGGNMMSAAQINNQQFLNSANAKDLEQDRQEDMFNECFDWNLFGDSAYVPQ